MNEQPFLNKLSDITQTPAAQLNDATAITPAEWDSVDLLDLIAAIDDSFGVTVEVNAIKQCKTVGELRQLVDAAAAKA